MLATVLFQDTSSPEMAGAAIIEFKITPKTNTLIYFIFIKNLNFFLLEMLTFTYNIYGILTEDRKYSYNYFMISLNIESS